MMLRSYYYIPVSQQGAFAGQMNAFRAKHPEEYTNTSGFYKADGQPSKPGYSPVIGEKMRGEGNDLYPNSYEQDGTTFNLIGFILEGYIKYKDPDGYNAMIGLPGVYEQPSEELFRDYLNAL